MMGVHGELAFLRFNLNLPVRVRARGNEVVAIR